jgi:hypothetical protein
MSVEGREKNRPDAALGAVIADRLDRTAFHCLFALRLFLGRAGLLVNVRVTTVIAPRKIGRGRFAAEVTIDALIIDEKTAGNVFRVFVFEFGHDVVIFDWEA